MRRNASDHGRETAALRYKARDHPGQTYAKFMEHKRFPFPGIPPLRRTTQNEFKYHIPRLLSYRITLNPGFHCSLSRPVGT